jgi:hypothetical protein
MKSVMSNRFIFLLQIVSILVAANAFASNGGGAVGSGGDGLEVHPSPSPSSSQTVVTVPGDLDKPRGTLIIAGDSPQGFENTATVMLCNLSEDGASYFEGGINFGSGCWSRMARTNISLNQKIPAEPGNYIVGYFGMFQVVNIQVNQTTLINLKADTATLLVAGTPGAEQKNTVKISECATSADGTPTKFSCDFFSADYPLNQQVSLRPGYYHLTYSHTDTYVRLGSSETREIDLKQLKVAQSAHPVEFSVFLDLTNPSEQDAYLKREFLDAHTDSMPDCRVKLPRGESEDKLFCQVVRQNDYRKFSEIVHFYPDASVTGFHGGLGTQVKVTDPQSGEFVSVFPGVYGIDFRDTETGDEKSQFGIQVE